MVSSLVELPGGESSTPATAVVRALVHGSVWISLGAASVAVSTALLAGFPLEFGPPFLAFSVTLFVYSFDRVADRDADERTVPRRAAFVRSYGRAIALAGVALYLLAACLAVALELPAVQAMALPPLVAVLYTSAGLKRVFLVKNLLVGAAWGLVPLGVGAYYGAPARVEVVAFAGFIAAMLTIAAAIFDVKDVAGDAERGIRTLPTEFGPRVTRRIAAAATVAVAAVVVALVVGGALPRRFLAVLPFSVYVLCYSVVATPDRGPLFYGFLVDGEHLFLAAVLLATELLG